jgi:hypothetical protein
VGRRFEPVRAHNVFMTLNYTGGGLRNSVFFINPFSMLVAIAATKRDAIFYYCYNEKDFRVKGRRSNESQRIVESIATSLNLELRVLDLIPSDVKFKQDDLVDPFLLGRRIIPKGKVRPDLIGWNADLYLKFSNPFRINYPFKSYKIIKAWKEAECFRYYNDVVLHPAIKLNSLLVKNSKVIEKKRWNVIIRSLTAEKSFHELFFGKYQQEELTLILFPHPTSASVNSEINELANDLIKSQRIKQVIVKEHPNADSLKTIYFEFMQSVPVTTHFFEPKEMPAEILVNFFEKNFTLGIASGAHVENPPERSFILDSKIDRESKLWSIYYSKFYSVTGHKVESKKQISRRIRSLK